MAGDSRWTSLSHVILPTLFLLQNVVAIKRTLPINGLLCRDSVKVWDGSSLTLIYKGEQTIPRDCSVRFFTSEFDRNVCFSVDPNSKFGIDNFRVEYRKFGTRTPNTTFDYHTSRSMMSTPVCSTTSDITLYFIQPVPYYRKDPFRNDVMVSLFVYSSPRNKVQTHTVVSTGQWIEDSVYVMVGCIVGVIAIMAVCIICCCYCCCKQACRRQTSRGTVVYRGQPQEGVNMMSSPQFVPPPQQTGPMCAGYQPSPQGYQPSPQGYQPSPQPHTAGPVGYASVPQQDNRPPPSAPPLPPDDDLPPPYPGY